MTILTLNLPPDLYDRLRTTAQEQGKPVEAVALEWLAEKSPPAQPMTDRERARAALRAAGLLAEISPREKELADQSTLTLEEARAILDRTEGPPLSEVILEMRGPKE